MKVKSLLLEINQIEIKFTEFSESSENQDKDLSLIISLSWDVPHAEKEKK